MTRPNLRNRLITAAMFAGVAAVAILARYWPLQQKSAPLRQDGAPSSNASVDLRIRFADEDRDYPGLPWRQGMTVRDVMDAAAKDVPALVFACHGFGEAAFLDEIGGVRNEGGGAASRNWQLWVNGVFATRSFELTRVPAGALVEWRYDVRIPDRGDADD